MMQTKKTTALLGGLAFGTLIGFLFSANKVRKSRKTSSIDCKKEKSTLDDKNSFYDSLSNLALMNETLFQSNTI